MKTGLQVGNGSSFSSSSEIGLCEKSLLCEQSGLLVIVMVPLVVDEVIVTVHALLLHAGHGVENLLVGEHGPTVARKILDVAVAFEALGVLEGCVSLAAIFGPVVVVGGVHHEMGNHVFDPVEGLHIEEVDGVVGGREMAVHAVRHEALPVVDVARCLPGIVSPLDFVA